MGGEFAGAAEVEGEGDDEPAGTFAGGAGVAAFVDQGVEGGGHAERGIAASRPGLGVDAGGGAAFDDGLAVLVDGFYG